MTAMGTDELIGLLFGILFAFLIFLAQLFLGRLGRINTQIEEISKKVEKVSKKGKGVSEKVDSRTLLSGSQVAALASEGLKRLLEEQERSSDSSQDS